MNARRSTLTLKPRVDITRSPKQGHQLPPQKGPLSSNNLEKGSKTSLTPKNKASFFQVSILNPLADSETGKGEARNLKFVQPPLAAI